MCGAKSHRCRELDASFHFRGHLDAAPAALFARAATAVKIGFEPAHRVVHDCERRFMAAIELVKFDRVTGLAQRRHKAAARFFNRQNVIRPAVGDEDARIAATRFADKETGRERDDLRKKIAIRDRERQRVGRSIGETAERKAVAVDRAFAKRCLKRAINLRRVRPEAACARTPGIPR